MRSYISCLFIDININESNFNRYCFFFKVAIRYVYKSLFKRVEENIKSCNNTRMNDMFLAIRARLLAIGCQLQDAVFSSDIDERKPESISQTFSDLHIMQLNCMLFNF